jgi:hypothetical protein
MNMRNKSYKRTIIFALTLFVILTISIIIGCNKPIDIGKQPKFVAVAFGEDGAYSIDGIKWKRATLPVNAAWETVCYGDQPSH